MKHQAPKQAAGPKLKIGWLNSVMDVLADKRAYLYSATPDTRIILQTTYGLFTKYPSKAQLLGACRLASLNDIRKSTKTAQLTVSSSAPADSTITMDTYKLFGFRLKLIDTFQNWMPGVFDVQVKDSSTLLYEFQLESSTPRPPIEVTGLFATIGGGQATITGTAAGVLVVKGTGSLWNVTSATTTTAGYFAEGLNEKDLAA